MKQVKFLFIIGLLSVSFVACEKVNKDDKGKSTADSANGKGTTTSNGGESNMALTTIEWAEHDHDFGKIPATDSVKHIFWFTNTGSSPAKIMEVKPACGCTSGKHTKEEVAPGEKGFVELKFDPKGKTGIQSKSATVILNTDPKTHSLTFKAEIK
jgi:Protein of unknown function (DUF1573)